MEWQESMEICEKMYWWNIGKSLVRITHGTELFSTNIVFLSKSSKETFSSYMWEFLNKLFLQYL